MAESGFAVLERDRRGVREPLINPVNGELSDLQGVRSELSDGNGPKGAPGGKPPKKRLVSLDAVRGLTVGVMIFVDNVGDWLLFL